MPMRRLEKWRVDRLIQRHVDHGKNPAPAEQWVMTSGQANVELVARTRSWADVLVGVD